VVATTTFTESRRGTGALTRPIPSGEEITGPAPSPLAWPLRPEHGLGDTTGAARATGPLRGSWGLARRVDRLPASPAPQTTSGGAPRDRGAARLVEIEVSRHRGRLRPRTWDRRAARAPARAPLAVASHDSARLYSMQSSVPAPASENMARLSATA
jgi:hypothetical protein